MTTLNTWSENQTKKKEYQAKITQKPELHNNK